ncbi:MAG: hypothetical protein EBS00_06915 [Verrucomicrobia bacterium]|nr:hypothetical protein [Verrucomicrobiota bacterium]
MERWIKKGCRVPGIGKGAKKRVTGAGCRVTGNGKDKRREARGGGKVQRCKGGKVGEGRNKRQWEGRNGLKSGFIDIWIWRRK